VNEDIKRWWSATSGHAGEYLIINLTRKSTINAIQVNFADEGATQLGRVSGLYYQYVLQVSDDGTLWKTVVNKSTNTVDLPHELIQLDPPAIATLVRIVNVHVPEPILFSLYGLRIFGTQDRAPPTAPTNLVVSRHTDTRSVSLSWGAVANAIGYNVRFGVDPKKLYHNYIAYDRTTLDINALLANQDYWFTVDAFNEGGITEGTTIVGPKAPTAALSRSRTPPVITRTSSPLWGTFPSTGPAADQLIDYTLADATGNQSWKVSWRFDAEAFRAGAAEGYLGANTYTFPRTAFTGSRLAAGSHTVGVQATGSISGANNVISVSYTIARDAGGVGYTGRIVMAVAVAAAGIGMAWLARGRKREEPVVEGIV
jgi:hypothetical protein